MINRFNRNIFCSPSTRVLWGEAAGMACRYFLYPVDLLCPAVRLRNVYPPRFSTAQLSRSDITASVVPISSTVAPPAVLADAERPSSDCQLLQPGSEIIRAVHSFIDVGALSRCDIRRLERNQRLNFKLQAQHCRRRRKLRIAGTGHYRVFLRTGTSPTVRRLETASAITSFCCVTSLTPVAVDRSDTESGQKIAWITYAVFQ